VRLTGAARQTEKDGRTEELVKKWKDWHPLKVVEMVQNYETLAGVRL
jgi:hypothetical protein